MRRIRRRWRRRFAKLRWARIRRRLLRLWRRRSAKAALASIVLAVVWWEWTAEEPPPMYDPEQPKRVFSHERLPPRQASSGLLSVAAQSLPEPSPVLMLLVSAGLVARRREVP